MEWTQTHVIAAGGFLTDPLKDYLVPQYPRIIMTIVSSIILDSTFGFDQLNYTINSNKINEHCRSGLSFFSWVKGFSIKISERGHQGHNRGNRGPGLSREIPGLFSVDCGKLGQ